MTADGPSYARFGRALDVRSVMQAEMAARELDPLGLLDALDYLVLLAAEAPDRYRPDSAEVVSTVAERLAGADDRRGRCGARLLAWAGRWV
jgi:hypothetical protein